MKVLILTCMVFCIVHTALSICPANSVCREDRSTIYQLAQTISMVERTHNRGRAWYIQPSSSLFNIILAFKNFNTTIQSPVMLITYYNQTVKTVQYLYGAQGDFEIVKQNAMTIILYAPIRMYDSAEFILHYYAGCDILTTTESQFVYPPRLNSGVSNSTKCWIIHPFNTNARERIYFSFRNVLLDRDQKLQLWDLHTSAFIGELSEVTTHHLVVANSYAAQLVMVELACGSTNSPQCNMRRTQMTANYYAMNSTDVDCIQNQMRCTLDNGTMLEGFCRQLECAGLNNMLSEEYGMEESSGPVTRSGDASTNRNLSMRVVKNCKLGIRYCQCPKKINLLSFCIPKIKCKKLPICVYHCMKAKILCASIWRQQARINFQILL